MYSGHVPLVNGSAPSRNKHDIMVETTEIKSRVDTLVMNVLVAHVVLFMSYLH